MKEKIQEFIIYLRGRKQASDNTVRAYERDLNKLTEYLEKHGITDITAVTETTLNSYMLELERKGLTPSTVSRKVASVRAFYRYLLKMHVVQENVAEELKPPRVMKKTTDIMSLSEIELLLSQPDHDTAKGIRDQAMLELLYGTGIRISELISLRLTDINQPLGYMICRESGRERIVSLGVNARQALDNYLRKGRMQILGERESSYLFTNFAGNPMSRQGVWKILKGYARSAGIEKEVTSYSLHRSSEIHLIQKKTM